jgi:hypothetical protein
MRVRGITVAPVTLCFPYELTEDTVCKFKLDRWDAREGNICGSSYIMFVIRKQQNAGMQRNKRPVSKRW